MNKKATITKCEFTGDFQHPSGNTYYYHEINLDNGDVGSCGKVEKFPFELAVGNYIEYTIDAKKKIKLVQVLSKEQEKRHSYSGGKGKTDGKKGFLPYDEYIKQKNQKKPEEFLGYAWSYAKDLVIAGKKMKDVQECSKIAEFIYDKIKTMLKATDDAVDTHENSDLEAPTEQFNDDLPFD